MVSFRRLVVIRSVLKTTREVAKERASISLLARSSGFASGVAQSITTSAYIGAIRALKLFGSCAEVDCENRGRNAVRT